MSDNNALGAAALRGKTRYAVTTDSALISAIERNELHDPIGGVVGSTWYVVCDWRLDRYRERLVRASEGRL